MARRSVMIAKSRLDFPPRVRKADFTRPSRSVSDFGDRLNPGGALTAKMKEEGLDRASLARYYAPCFAVAGTKPLLLVLRLLSLEKLDSVCRCLYCFVDC
jgi:hypothetical protein